MAKKVEKIARLQTPAGRATSVPPVDPVLDQADINIMGFTRELNTRTVDQAGLVIPAVVPIYEDHSFTFITKTSPAAVLLKKAAKIERGSGEPNKNRVAEVPSDQVGEIAELKMEDLNAANVETAIRMVKETARSIRITVG